MDQTLIRQIVEAALLAAPQPLTLAQLAGLFPEDEPAPNGSLQQALDELIVLIVLEDARLGVDLVREMAFPHRIRITAQPVHSQMILNERVVDEGQHLLVTGKPLIKRIHGGLSQLPIGIVQ